MNFRYVTGQSCNSTSRVYLHDAIHDATLPEIVKRVRAAQGRPADRAATPKSVACRARRSSTRR